MFVTHSATPLPGMRQAPRISDSRYSLSRLAFRRPCKSLRVGAACPLPGSPSPLPVGKYECSCRKALHPRGRMLEYPAHASGKSLLAEPDQIVTELPRSRSLNGARAALVLLAVKLREERFQSAVGCLWFFILAGEGEAVG